MYSQELLNLKGIRFVHINTRSLYRKIDQISHLFGESDFLICTETWLNAKYKDNLIAIDGMSIYRNDRCNAQGLPNVPKRGGGVLIYVKNKWAPYVRVCVMATVITTDYESVFDTNFFDCRPSGPIM